MFQIEGQFEVGTGALDGDLFGRQAWVGLDDARWGTLTLGNQYEFMFMSLSMRRLGPELPYMSLTNLRQGPFDALGKPGPFSGDFDFDRTAGASRISNSVKYQSPSIGGLTFGAMYGFSNLAGGFSNQNAYSFGIDYEQPSYSIDAAYTMTKYAQINGGADGIRNFGVDGRVAIMRGRADLLYTNTRNTFSGATINVFEVDGTVPLSYAVHLYAAYQYMAGNAVLQDNRASAEPHARPCLVEAQRCRCERGVPACRRRQQYRACLDPVHGGAVVEREPGDRASRHAALLLTFR
ncbi:porin [Burkholderia gladioli]|uniref:porin n=1 Tax=Burkholderia gladioli TaxID=28095 RepID=UPI00163F8F81|nr:porin [Burkholderia gladioli]